MVELFSNGTKKHVYLDKIKALDPFNGDNFGEIEIKTIIVVILAIIIGAILTGVAPVPLGLLTNATVVNDTTATGFNGSLAFATSSTKTAFSAIPIGYVLALLLVPVAIVIKAMD